MITVAIAGSAVGIVISVSRIPTLAEVPVASATAPAAPLETPWGVTDLQAITKPTRLTSQGKCGHSTQALE
jgi:hypothetical protein